MISDGNTPDSILGQEFLTWLWYRTDTDPTAFSDKEGVPFSVSLEQRITVEGGTGEERETAAVSGAYSPLREARFGLGTGKKVTRALLQLTREESVFRVTLKAEDFSCGSMKTPKVEKAGPDDDPEGAFFEKVYLLETCVGMLDRLYETFLKLRLDPISWEKEALAISRWTARPDPGDALR